MEESDYEKIVPELDETIEFHQTAADEYVLFQKGYGHQLRINSFTKKVLDLIDGERSVLQITTLVEGSKIECTNEQIYDLLYTRLISYGVIKGAASVTKKQQANYLKLRFPLIPIPVVASLSRLFRHLFIRPTLFFITFGVMILGLITAAIYALQYPHLVMSVEAVLSGTDILSLFLFSVGATLLHEIGHTSALAYFNRNAGEIGVGFYVFFPVFYCDVSESWLLSKKQRLMVNFGGLYFEGLIACGFLLYHFIFGAPLLVWFSLIILLHFLVNLNPFLRRDGYWVLSDLTNIPNLQRDALRYVVWYVKNLFGSKNTGQRTNRFLLWYGVFSILFLSLFLFLVILTNPKSILYFPMNIWELANHFLRYGISLDQLFVVLRQFVLPLLFYYLLFKLIVNWVRKKIWTEQVTNLQKAR